MSSRTWTYPNSAVIRVIDGDTLDVAIDLGFNLTFTHKVRLRGVDCPERKGDTKDAGESAKRETERLISAGLITVVSHRWDKYGRICGDVLLADGSDLGERLVNQGYAVKVK